MIIILLGPPGAGKGTIANEINKRVPIPIVATGDILRNAIEANTDLGKKAKSFVLSGKLVPDEYIIKIVEDRIAEHDCEKGFIFDGFPRTVVQSEALDSILKKRNIKVNVMLNIDVKTDELVKRLLIRGKTSGRSDDNLETFSKRFDTYMNETSPVIDYYKNKNILFEIDSNLDKYEIFN